MSAVRPGNVVQPAALHRDSPVRRDVRTDRAVGAELCRAVPVSEHIGQGVIRLLIAAPNAFVECSSKLRFPDRVRTGIYARSDDPRVQETANRLAVKCAAIDKHLAIELGDQVVRK